ncbi:hypothetical protein XO12_03705 [Marinitoga sp. 1154]|uniref:DUF402 domain-containing protein n=1 Tax=Marinitoga sp. 1154 TaxID=1643335 RepID=UPI001586DDF3|nr:DUF402 domain-containing protein [Marinitoga sp. 1154]NUU99247.1 hypothetical protein [Marinitoga sp. 1154]
MKHYKFNLKNKKEWLLSPTREVNVDIETIYSFNNSFGIERKWIILDNHNSIKKIKRLLLPDKMIMLTSFLTSDDCDIKDYLIYIDFGKYSKKNDIIEFFDLELDIIIKRDMAFNIEDMDELIKEFKKGNITSHDFYSVLIESTRLINSFQKYKNPINSLMTEINKESIEWLIDLG